MENKDDSSDRTLPAAKAVDVAKLVEYVEGSVVSRTIAENEAGTITAFAFGAGQGLSEHTAPFDAVVQILDGEAELTIGGEAVRAAAGQLVIMPADVPHSVRATQPFKMLLTMLRSK
jgi:quercetin dioxygenase-like cupin family protein